jgi:TPR repeat protein
MISRMSVAAALVAAVCAVQCVTWGADAQSLFEQAIKAQDSDLVGGQTVDLKAALALFEKAAKEGSAAAMQRLGDMYHDGDGGVTKDYAKAMEWYRSEAALDDSHPGSGAMGMIALGEMYENGRGVTQDKTQADEWFKKALASAKAGADKGDAMAMTALAYCLAEGKGTEADPVGAWAWVVKSADPSTALNYVLRAAQMGVSRDMVDVSLAFASGSGVKKDEKTAVDWIKKAVDRGNSQAMGILGRYYHLGVGLDRSDLSAKECFQKAIDLGDEDALGYMGDMFIMPGANPRDVKSARSWYEKGVAAGDSYSMYQLAKLLSYDPDVTPDLNTAIALLTRSADLGYADALSAMGELYRDKIRSTPEERIVIFRKAAEAGSIAGMRDLGEALMEKAEGTNTYKSTDDDAKLMKEAAGWIQKAAAAGDLDAMTDLGDACLKGKGVTQSATNAILWYRKAATAGNVRAMRNLGRLFASDNVVANYDEAKYWFEKGIEKGDPACMSGLGELYDNAQGVTEDNNKAFDLYQRAAKGGDGGGYRGLAQYLMAANPPDYRQAAAYFTEAVRLGDRDAMEALGRMYELGEGVDKDMNQAMRLFTRAMDMGSQSAWSWVFSHTDFTSGSATMGSSQPSTLRLPDLTGNLPPRRTPESAPSGTR